VAVQAPQRETRGTSLVRLYAITVLVAAVILALASLGTWFTVHLAPGVRGTPLNGGQRGGDPATFVRLFALAIVASVIVWFIARTPAVPVVAATLFGTTAVITIQQILKAWSYSSPAFAYDVAWSLWTCFAMSVAGL
jgi:hypothetical protein